MPRVQRIVPARWQKRHDVTAMRCVAPWASGACGASPVRSRISAQTVPSGIPSVVKAFEPDGRSVSQQLPDWFQQEIDRQAMEQGLIGSDEYLAQWEWSERQERPGSAEAVLAEVVAELERQRETEP